MDTIRPIFIVGSGRSGTTLLYRLIQGHPDLAWISRLTDRFPALPQLAALSRARWLRNHRAFGPSTDAMRVYDYCGITDALLRAKGESLTEADVPPGSAARMQRIVLAHARWMNRPRFVNKSTMNTMRIRLVHHIFPDARFIHIVRNGYAVANSLVRVDWWPDAELWWKDTTPRRWEERGGNPHELAALNWKRQVGEILKNKSRIPAAQYFECRYERMLTDTTGLLKDLLRFCDLEWNAGFTEHLRSVPVTAHNKDKWREELDGAAKKAITGAAGDLIESLGYDVVS